MPRQLVYDRWLLVITVLLVAGGLFMVGSASNHFALESGKSPSTLWWKQATHLLLGFAALTAAMHVPYAKLADARLIAVLLVLCAVGLVAVRAMPEAGGSHRWLVFGPLRLQPSEFTKLAVVLLLARTLARKEERIDEVATVVLPCLGLVGAMACLVAVENLGSAVVLVAVAGALLFAAGLGRVALAGIAAGGALAFVAAVWAKPYRWERITAFLDPWADPRESGFQLIQSLIAFGNGGLVGVGPGHGQQKALFLPAAHTDFIFSIVGEELGLVGGLALIGAFLLLFWRGLRAALHAPDRFGSYLALGLTLLLVVQALINMSICVGLLPTTGLPLPFISYGGSSLVTSMLAMGLLLSVSQHSR